MHQVVVPAHMDTLLQARRYLGAHAVAAYFLLALAVSWTVAIPLALVGVGILHLPLPFGLHYLAALGPITAALVVSGAGEGRFGLANLLHAVTRWRIGWRWWLVASSPVGLFTAAALLARLVEGS